MHGHFNPQEPIVELPDKNLSQESLSQKSDKAEGVIDLRKRMGLALVE